MKHSMFNARESITMGIFTALILTLNMALLIPLHFLPGALVLFKEAIVALVTAPIYVILWTKVPKKGVFTVCALGTGLTYVIFGFFTVAAVTLMGGLVADGIAGTRGFADKTRNLAAYALFSASKALGTYIPFYLWGARFIEELAERGQATQEFLEVFRLNLTLPMGAAVIMVNMVLAVCGGLIGYKMLRTRYQSWAG